MVAVAAILVCALLSFSMSNASPFGRYWRPSFLLSAFALIGLAFTYSEYGFDDLSLYAQVYYATAIATFLFGDFIATFFSRRGARWPSSGEFEMENLVLSPLLVYIYVSLGVVAVIVLYYVFSQRTSLFSMLDVASALRYSAVSENLPSYGAFHLVLFAQVVGSVLILSPRRYVRIVGYLCSAVGLVASFVAVARTMVLFTLGSVAFLLYVRSRSVWVIAVPAAAALGLMFLYAGLRAVPGADDNFLAQYAGYGIYNFQDYVLFTTMRDFGVQSFGTPATLLLGWEAQPIPLLEGQYNVFTFISAPYRDFGFLGLIFVPMLFGFIWSFIWNRTGRRPFYLLMYSWMLFPCLIPFFDWQFSLTLYLYLPAMYLILVKPSFRTTDASRPELRQVATA